MTLKAPTREAYKLLMDGSLALAKVEANGIRIDVPYLEKAIKRVTAKIETMEDELRQDDVYKVWEKKFGKSTNLGSNEQLGTILFDVLKYPCREYTNTVRRDGSRRPKTDKKTLQRLNHPFIKKRTRIEEWKKARGTFLEGIYRETVDGFLHACFWLNTVTTYRTSSSEPNFQNFPVRDSEIGEMVRSSFIPRKGHLLLELDFKQIEVSVAAIETGDPNLIRYVSDPKKDMHRDQAMRCYLLPASEINKLVRYTAKNMFVFPQFYGDFYIHCAQYMWEAMELLNLKTVSGIPLRKHMASKGIKRLGACNQEERPIAGTFEYHIKAEEDRFWNQEFLVYARWKKRVWEEYQRDGGFPLLTGFVERGIYSRNDVTNHRIQGAAAHIAVWTIIQLNKWLAKNKMRSKVVGTVHDSILIDAHLSEWKTVKAKAIQIATVDVRKAWDWVSVPLVVECEIARENWFRKAAV